MTQDEEISTGALILILMCIILGFNALKDIVDAQKAKAGKADTPVTESSAAGPGVSETTNAAARWPKPSDAR